MVASNVVLIPLNRIIYGTTVTVEGQEKQFQRPFFLEFVMFLAMASCLILEVPGWCKRRREAPIAFWPSRMMQLKLLMPALCDLIGSWFIFSGALWLPASVVEMLSCSNTVFTLFLSVCFLKKRVVKHEWAGIALSFMGVLFVGLSQMMSRNTGPSAGQGGSVSTEASLTALGFLCVMLAHFWYAVEFVVTEKLLGENDLSAFMSVGMMGLWGIVLFVPLFALLQLTPTSPDALAPLWHENVAHSLLALEGKPILLLAVVALFVALIAFNAAAFKTTELLSALSRVVIGSAVSPLVWVLDLCLATLTHGHSGAAERLSAWSLLQLLGFLLILSGTLVYNAVGPCGRTHGADDGTPGDIALISERPAGS